MSLHRIIDGACIDVFDDEDDAEFSKVELSTVIDEARYEDALELGRSLSKADRGRGLVKKGNSNKRAIKALQERLTGLGHTIEVDGIYGDETEKAVRAFQKKRGAMVDGVVGQETLGKLLRATPHSNDRTDPGLDAITKTVEPGAKQTAKRTRGLGDIRAEQRGGGKKAEEPKGPHGGAIDPVTGKEIASSKTGPIGSTQVTAPTNMSFEDAHPRGGKGSTAGGKFVKKGDSGSQTRNVQRRVNTAVPRKKNKLSVDGEFGPKTESRVKMFQAQAGLVVDGVVGPKTSGALVRQANRRRTRRAGVGGG